MPNDFQSSAGRHQPTIRTGPSPATSEPENSGEVEAIVREVVLSVAHREPRRTMQRREDAGWTVVEHAAGEAVELASVAATLEVDDRYRDGLEDAG